MSKYSDKDMIESFMSFYENVLEGRISHVINLNDRVILTGGKEDTRHLYLQFASKGKPLIFSIARPGLSHCFFVDEDFVIYDFLQKIAEKGLITLPAK